MSYKRLVSIIFISAIINEISTQFNPVDSKNGCVPDCNCYTNSERQYKVDCSKLPTQLPENTVELQVRSVEEPLLGKHNLPKEDQTNQIRTLDICNANIKFIEDGVLQRFPQLVVLKLSANMMKTIDADLFRGCNHLEEIFLDNNNISHIETDCFEGLNKLKSLNLQSNQLKQLPKLPTSLQRLDLSDNNLSVLPKNADDLTSLKYLDICKNKIKALNYTDLRYMPLESLCTDAAITKTRGERDAVFVSPELPLHNLTLIAHPGHDRNLDALPVSTENYLMNLTIVGYNIQYGDIFKKLTNLEHLTLTNDEISAAEEEAFASAISGMKSLKILDLSESPSLAHAIIDREDVWDSLHSLEGVNFRKCSLTTLGRLGTFRHPKSQERIEIDVSGNNLQCSCEWEESFKHHLNTDLSKIMCKEADREYSFSKYFEDECHTAPHTATDSDSKQENNEHLSSTNYATTASSTTPTYNKTKESIIKKKVEKKDITIIVVVLVVALIAAVIFVALFFYFKRRGHTAIEGAIGHFSKKENSRADLVNEDCAK